MVIPQWTESNKPSYVVTTHWVRAMMPDAHRLVNMMSVHVEAQETMTLLEREQEKIKKQFEIRQDVTDVMHAYIHQLKVIIEDPELPNKMEHKDYLKLYEIIRLEEDRAKALSLKERSENRADAMFAWMVSQAKAGQLSDEDIQFLDDDIKADLLIFKGQNGIYQLPSGSIPKIRFAAKAADQ